MTIIIAAVFALFLIAGARAGTRTNQHEEVSDALDRCPRCGNYLPCNCNHSEDTSYQHHHHDQWASGTMNQSQEDDSCFIHGHHHHGGSDDWN